VHEDAVAVLLSRLLEANPHSQGLRHSGGLPPLFKMLETLEYQADDVYLETLTIYTGLSRHSPSIQDPVSQFSDVAALVISAGSRQEPEHKRVVQLLSRDGDLTRSLQAAAIKYGVCHASVPEHPYMDTHPHSERGLEVLHLWSLNTIR